MSVDSKGLKLSIDLTLPMEQEYKPSLDERLEDAMERVEFEDCKESYKFIKCLNKCLVHCWNKGHKTPVIHEMLGKVTPFLAKHGLEDASGLELIEEFVTNPEYKERENDE